MTEAAPQIYEVGSCWYLEPVHIGSIDSLRNHCNSLLRAAAQAVPVGKEREGPSHGQGQRTSFIRGADVSTTRYFLRGRQVSMLVVVGLPGSA